MTGSGCKVIKKERTGDIAHFVLQVDYSGFSTINPQRFGQKYVGKVRGTTEACCLNLPLMLTCMNLFDNFVRSQTLKIFSFSQNQQRNARLQEVFLFF